MKTVCVITGTRAEYGLLKPTLSKLQASDRLELQLVVTGAHLSPEHGQTYQEIINDGFSINQKMEMLLSSDTSLGMTKSTGLALCGFADTFELLKPDIVLLLGDRYEIFAAASAAMLATIPIAHIHGGEKTNGAIDDAMRHCISKMSHVHFVASEEYRSRVLQLGELPGHVHVVGGLAVENIQQQALLGRREIETELGFTFDQKNLLVTFHPTTLSKGESSQQISELLDALSKLSNTRLIFTMPNADAESRALANQISSYVKTNETSASCFTSLGQLRYLSCMQYVDAVVGNSSSGLLEAPAFRIGTINIGDRQTGRTKASSVIDCQAEAASILAAIDELYSVQFQRQLETTVNPFDKGNASEKIVTTLENLQLDGLLRKEFQDLDYS